MDPVDKVKDDLLQVLDAIKKLETDQSQLSGLLNDMHGRVEQLSFKRDIAKMVEGGETLEQDFPPKTEPAESSTVSHKESPPQLSPSDAADTTAAKQSPTPANHAQKRAGTSRIILTTYPGQSGIDPIPMDWGNSEPAKRGPVVVSRHQGTVRRRNGLFSPIIRLPSNWRHTNRWTN